MMLRLAEFRSGREPAVDAAVADGGWERIGHPHPDELLAAIAGMAASVGGVLLDGRDITGVPAHARTRAGLGSSPGRVPDIPALRVVDVLLCARGTRLRGQAWRAAVGSRRARQELVDEEAAARSLAGRCGVAAWTDRPAVGLPDDVAAVVDALRALGGRPRALVWRRPEWLGPEAIASVERVLRMEQRRLGFGVLEVYTVAAPAPADGAVIITIRR